MSRQFEQDYYHTPNVESPMRLAFWYVPLALTVLLVPCSIISIDLFHILAELFAIGIAMMSFVVAWNTFPLLRDKFTLMLGIGYFWVGTVDLLHALTFKNLIHFGGLRFGATLEFWIGARFLEAFILILAPLLMTSNIEPKRMFYAGGVLVCLLFYLVFSQALPPMIIHGQGLTPLKVGSEYAIIALLLIASLVFYLRRDRLDKHSLLLVHLSIFFTILAELSFTLYIEMKDVPVVVGHIFKLLSFWLIYRLLIESALLRPIKSMDQVVKSFDSVSEQTVIIDQDGYIQYANTATRNKHDKPLVGLHCHEILHESSLSRNQCPICLELAERKTIQVHEFFSGVDKQWYEASVSNIMMGESASSLIHTIRNISARKNNEQQVVRLSRLYHMLGESNKALSQFKDIGELFQKVCDIGVNQGAFKMVWIGIIKDTLVQPEYYAGAETGYLREMQMRVDDSEWAKGPVGIAAKTKHVAFVNDVETDPDFWPWREAALQRGYGSLAAVPILSQDQVIGLFTLYSEQKDVFDAQMITILENLSRDLSIALYHIEQEKQRLISEATIHKLSQAVEQSVNGILIADMAGRAEYVNPQFTALTGYSTETVMGNELAHIAKLCIDGDYSSEIWGHLKKGESWQGQLPCLKEDGSRYWALISVSLIVSESGEPSHFVVSGIDNTDLHEAQETIRKLAFFDALTGLANRRLLMDRMQHAMALAHTHNELVAVMLCDLDNFKMINDSMGHDAGDMLLKKIANDLKGSVGENDTVARLGGDEFVIILEGVKDIDHVITVASNIFEAFGKTTLIKGSEVSVASSMGVSIYPQDGSDPNQLLKNADLAMYHAKDLGKGRVQFYQGEMNLKVQERLVLEQKLKVAVAKQRFHLVYQPQVEIDTQRIVGYEALIRWRDGSQTFSPAEFIPLAEETGLIEQMGTWVIEQVARDWPHLNAMSDGKVSVAVNVSARQFEKADNLFSTIESALQDSNMPASTLTVEITEGTLIGDIEETTATLNRLKGLGLMISIDDFGTGYSSLSYLKRFPIDQLKIDRSFVDDLLVDENDQAIVAAIIAIAQKLGIKLVAEGVEESAQGETLLAQGCRHAQGFYYYKPMTLRELRDTLAG